MKVTYADDMHDYNSNVCRFSLLTQLITTVSTMDRR
jgi:hypothetical protein